MPIQYTSIMDEHKAVRGQVGIFDISHMGQLFVSGKSSEDWLNRLLTNNVSKLELGTGQYTLMLNKSGGVIDDLILYQCGKDSYFLVVNASKIDEDVKWLTEHSQDGCSLLDDSPNWAGMAIQGPESAATFAKVCPGETLPERNGIATMASGHIVCRTGYTGEDGFEYFCRSSDGPAVWTKFIEAGAKPCGLGARDSLRLEMGYPLNGNDLSSDRSPIEAGLGFFCDLEKGDFIGRETLAAQKSQGLKSKLTALKAIGKSAPPRAQYPVANSSGEPIGELCSGVLSPSLMSGIAMAYLPVEFSKRGTEVQVDVRGRLFPFQVVKKPFYHKSKQTKP